MGPKLCRVTIFFGLDFPSSPEFLWPLAFVQPPWASSHIIPHRIASHHIISYLYHIISYHITSYYIISHHITFHHIMLYRAIFKSHVGILCKANSSLFWLKFVETRKSRCSHRVLWRGLLPEAWTNRRMNMWHVHTERHTSPHIATIRRCRQIRQCHPLAWSNSA